MNLSTLSRRLNLSQVNMAGAGAAVAALALTIALAYPALRTRHERATLQGELAAVEAAVTATQARIAAARSQLAKLGARVQDDDESNSVDRRVLVVSSLAAGTELVVDSVEPGAGVNKAGARWVPIAVNGHGSYPRVLAFLQKLRETSPDVTLEAAQLNAAADGLCGFRLVLNWWRPPAGQTTAATLAEVR